MPQRMVLILRRLEIREIEKDDVKDLMEIITLSKRDFPSGFYYNVYELNEEKVWDNFKSLKDFPTLVAVYNGKVIAIATNMRHWDEEDNFYIMLLLTHPEFRGLGAGTELIKSCFKLAVEKGFNVLSLHTWANNRAMKLYERLGFIWVPNTSVYMVNLLPQLLKHEKIKSLLNDPVELLGALKAPPERIIINGHVAWKYVLEIKNTSISAIFNNDTRKLLSIKIGGDYAIELIPPEKKDYVKNEELEINIETTHPLPAKINKELKLLSSGLNKLAIGAKKKIELTIDNFDFGFQLKVRDPIEIEIPSNEYIAPYNIQLIVRSNKGEINDELVVICEEGLRIHPNRIPINLKEDEYKIINLKTYGEGKATLKIAEEEIYVTSNRVIKIDDDGIVSRNWKITREEITPRQLEGLNIWYSMRLANRAIYPKFDKKYRRFASETKEALVYLKPEINGDVLDLKIEITALDNLDDELEIIFWAERENPGIRYLLPISDKSFIIEKYYYPSYPQSLSLYREKLPIPIIGFELRNRYLLIKYDEDGLYTLAYSPFDVILTFPLTLRKGEMITKSLRFMLSSDVSKLLGVKLKRMIEAVIEGNELVIKNNWLKPIELEVVFDSIGGPVRFEPSEVKKYMLTEKGYGKIDLMIKLGSMIEKRRLRYIIPIKVYWDYLNTEYKGMRIELSKMGATPKIIDLNGYPVLFWSNDKVRTPTRFPEIYGGIPLKIRDGSEDINLHLMNWEYIGEGLFRIQVRGLEITRSWQIVDNNVLAEILEIENKSNRLRKVRLYRLVALNDRIKVACSSNYCMYNDKDVLYLAGKTNIDVELKHVKINLMMQAARNQEISAIQIINWNGLIYSSWNWILFPGEKKKAYTIYHFELK